MLYYCLAYLIFFLISINITQELYLNLRKSHLTVIKITTITFGIDFDSQI